MTDVSREQEEGVNPWLTDPTKLTTDAVEKLERQVGEKLNNQADLFVEKIRGLQKQIDTAESWRQEQKVDNKTQIDAALQAQKEAAVTQDENNQKSIDKSERAMDEKVNKLEQLFKTTTDAQADKIDDLKSALGNQATLINGAYQQRAGMQEQKVEQRAISTGQVAVMGIVLVVLQIIIGVAFYFAGRT